MGRSNAAPLRCLWRTGRESKLGPAESQDPGPNAPITLVTRNNRSTAGSAADAAFGERHDCDQRSADCARDGNVSLDGVAMGGGTAETWRAGEGSAKHGIFSGESAGYADTGPAAQAAEGQFIRQARVPFFQDGFDESRGDGTGICGRAGRHGGDGGGADGGARASRAYVAFGKRRGIVFYGVAATAAGAGAGAAADDAGGRFRAYGDCGADGIGAGVEVAERPDAEWEESWVEF